MKIANKQTNLFRIPSATVNFCETKCCFCNIVLGNLVCCSFLSASLSRIGLVANTAGFIARCSDLDWFLSWIVVQTPIFTTRQSTRFTPPPPKKKRTFPTWRGRPCTDYALLQLVPAVCDLRPGLLDLPPLGFFGRKKTAHNFTCFLRSWIGRCKKTLNIVPGKIQITEKKAWFPSIIYFILASTPTH